MHIQFLFSELRRRVIVQNFGKIQSVYHNVSAEVSILFLEIFLQRNFSLKLSMAIDQAFARIVYYWNVLLPPFFPKSRLHYALTFEPGTAHWKPGGHFCLYIMWHVSFSSRWSWKRSVCGKVDKTNCNQCWRDWDIDWERHEEQVKSRMPPRKRRRADVESLTKIFFKDFKLDLSSNACRKTLANLSRKAKRPVDHLSF